MGGGIDDKLILIDNYRSTYNWPYPEVIKIPLKFLGSWSRSGSASKSYWSHPSKKFIRIRRQLNLELSTKFVDELPLSRNGKNPFKTSWIRIAIWTTAKIQSFVVNHNSTPPKHSGKFVDSFLSCPADLHTYIQTDRETDRQTHKGKNNLLGDGNNLWRYLGKSALIYKLEY